ncbi:putative receptor-type tyrosine-protein phosphatase kappa [Apostichopus japonicus]|uniref:Putative receptor-type tyrosine-protein phosphatase kappa n=1 Tax=Stichopus japonicus TaxID=307972 RepID=A0A2G8LD80_STIJA|nr:putative receptor-type tyrosine-protein phosphatase kappa [Apostichopus japonicus]
MQNAKVSLRGSKKSRVDHSRVPLDMLPNDPHSDYYNACYMLDQKDQIAFIASQGPNRASTNDFWRMLWKEDISIVVMVTNLIENGKDRCAQYWPQEQGMNKTWGLITVTWTGTQTYANYLIREMTMVQDEEQRTITQYHFTTWPDMGVPSEPTALISLVRKVKVQNKGKKTPILVHCSAGVGRTGTFIALYCLMDNLKSEKYINVYEFVEKMRKNRVNMVQTPVQYQFLCEALVEVYLTSHTEMPSGLLQNFDLTSKRDVLIEEFQLLNKLCANINLVSSVGQAPENASKNRFPDHYPPDQNRPFVSSDRNFGENDYINATFVNTCAKKDAIIIAQSPLPNTIEAFWRLVCDWRVPLIVMLNKLDRKDAKTCSVDQFQLLSWPDHGSVTGVVEMLEVTKLTLDKYETEPAIIHCIDGVGRSGAVVTVLSEIERVRRDGKVDIFQTARQLRSSNSLIMAEQEHYLACYQILQAFLENAPEYGNI